MILAPSSSHHTNSKLALSVHFAQAHSSEHQTSSEDSENNSDDDSNSAVSVDSNSSDEMEDDIDGPPSLLPVPIANALLAPKPIAPAPVPAAVPKPIGRPKQQIDMLAPLFEQENVTNIGDFIHAVHEVLARNNCTERFGKELHNVLKNTVNHSLPSYKKAVQVLRDSTNSEAKIYPVCPNECYVHDVSVENIPPQELIVLKCRYCQASFVNKDGKPKKVSYDYPGSELVVLSATGTRS